MVGVFSDQNLHIMYRAIKSINSHNAAIYATSAKNVEITENVIVGCKADPGAVYLEYCEDVKITNNLQDVDNMVASRNCTNIS
jgi:fructose-bisphosphate aldolase class 1